MARISRTLSLIAAFSLIGIAAAHAHKVTIFAWAEGDRVFTESKFSGGKMVKNGKVAVFDSHGQLLLEGQTDEKGQFSFTAPIIADLDIVLSAGMGHQNSWKLSAAELGPQSAAAAQDPPPPAAVVPEAVRPTPKTADASGLTAREVEAIVARQLDQKLQPLTRMIVAVQDKGPTLSDIFGGIGYILGLVGLGAYVRYRKEARRS